VSAVAGGSRERIREPNPNRFGTGFCTAVWRITPRSIRSARPD